jgi:hypothetical protein
MPRVLIPILLVLVFVQAGQTLLCAGTLGDVTGDNIVGIPEAIYALNVTSGLAPTFTTSSEITLASQYVEFVSYLASEGAREIFAVPHDKTFILTGVYGHIENGTNQVYLKEDELIKIKIVFPAASLYLDLPFNTGIPFSPDSTIKYLPVGNDAFISGSFAITGYFIQNVIEQNDN